MESKLYIPTMRELIEKYKEIVLIERSRNGKPQKNTEHNCIRSSLGILKDLDKYNPRSDGSSWLDAKYIEITRRVLSNYVDIVTDNKLMKKVSLKSKILCLGGLTAKWTIGYYEDFNWDIKPFTRPRILQEPKIYKRPSKEVLKRVFSWYNNLYNLGDKRFWLFATMMIQFGMRNGDVCQLTQKNFIEEDGQVYLFYEPHKTKLTSGRVIKWPVHDSIRKKNRISY